MLNQATIDFFDLKRIDPTWKDFFIQEANKEYFSNLLELVKNQYQVKPCWPKPRQVFRIFWEVKLTDIKVVILGQDPYHLPGVADGIAFSTEKPRFIPASLRNIYQELSCDLGLEKPITGNLISWVKRGIFLLNTALTVEESKPGSHSAWWEEFTFNLISYIKIKKPDLIWIFWGKKAQTIKEKCGIDDQLSLTSAHPSPFSVNYGFFGSRPFSRTNQKLLDLKKSVVFY